MNALASDVSWRGEHVAVNGTELWVVRNEGESQGPLIVVLHGGLGFDHTCFRPWLDPLAHGATLAYVDLRGQGRSERLTPDAWAAVTHATFVADIDGLRAALGYETMVLLGHSYGGFLALEYALAHPERLDALVVSSAGPSFDHGDVVAENAFARGGTLGGELLQAIADSVPDDATYARLYPRFLPLYFHGGRVPPGFMAETHYSAAAVNRGFSTLLPGWSVRERLGEIELPVLVLVGDDDFIQPRSVGADALTRGLGHARLEVIPASGHFPYAEDPERFVGAIKAFLQEVAA